MTDSTLLGLTAFLTSRTLPLVRIIIRDTLRPPPVEPAQAPQNISSTMTAFDSTGHMSKFVVEKPVVVIIEETWKNAYLKDSPTECLVSTATASASAAIQTMIYGNPLNYELGLFSDFTVRVDESYKAQERLLTILGDVMVGGNLVVDKGVVVATLPKSGG